MVWESNPSGGEIFRTRPDRPSGPVSLLYNGYRVFFQKAKWPWRGVDHPPLSSAEVKERVELYLYFRSGSSWPVLEQTLPLPLYEFSMRFVATLRPETMSLLNCTTCVCRVAITVMRLDISQLCQHKTDRQTVTSSTYHTVARVDCCANIRQTDSYLIDISYCGTC